MPFYLDIDNRGEIKKLLKYNVCAECGGQLEACLDLPRHQPYLRCKSNHDHDGIAREASQYQQKGMEALTIKARRDIMEKEFSKEKTTALAKYQGVTSLTKIQAKEVLATLWPGAEKASPAEYFKAMMLCTQYGLNPLMKHLFLIPFWNSDKKIYEHVCVQGITANRLIASRKHHWTFLDDTPRVGSEAEETRHYGEVNPDILHIIVKMRDIDTGAEVTAWGEWAKRKINKQGQKVPNQPKGVEKGNSMMNMGCVRAERKGLDMLYPADLPPSDIPVADENFIEGEGRVLPDDEVTPDIEEVEDTEQEAPPETASCIDLDWLKESLTKLQAMKIDKWTNKEVLARLNIVTGGQAKSVSEAAKLLNEKTAALFAKEIQDLLDMA